MAIKPDHTAAVTAKLVGSKVAVRPEPALSRCRGHLGVAFMLAE